MLRPENIVKNFSNHLNIIKIKQKFKLNNKLSFQSVSEASVREVVKNLPSDKTIAGEIPVNVLKINVICFFELIVLTKPLEIIPDS